MQLETEAETGNFINWFLLVASTFSGTKQATATKKTTQKSLVAGLFFQFFSILLFIIVLVAGFLVACFGSLIRWPENGTGLGQFN